MRKRPTLTWATALMLVASIPSCNVVKALSAGVLHPVSPEQSRAQVVDAAREIVRALGIRVVSASFWHSSCNDDGVEPFRGEVGISYPLAPSFEQSDAEVANMVQHLRSIGWAGDPSLHSHGTVLTKNHVVVDFAPQNVSTPNRGIDLLGECRDVTTTKNTRGPVEDVTFG